MHRPAQRPALDRREVAVIAALRHQRDAIAERRQRPRRPGPQRHDRNGCGEPAGIGLHRDAPASRHKAPHGRRLDPAAAVEEQPGIGLAGSPRVGDRPGLGGPEGAGIALEMRLQLGEIGDVEQPVADLAALVRPPALRPRPARRLRPRVENCLEGTPHGPQVARPRHASQKRVLDCRLRQKSRVSAGQARSREAADRLQNWAVPAQAMAEGHNERAPARCRPTAPWSPGLPVPRSNCAAHLATGPGRASGWIDTGLSTPALPKEARCAAGGLACTIQGDGEQPAVLKRQTPSAGRPALAIGATQGPGVGPGPPTGGQVAGWHGWATRARWRHVHAPASCRVGRVGSPARPSPGPVQPWGRQGEADGPLARSPPPRSGKLLLLHGCIAAVCFPARPRSRQLQGGVPQIPPPPTWHRGRSPPPVRARIDMRQEVGSCSGTGDGFFPSLVRKTISQGLRLLGTRPSMRRGSHG